MSKLRGAVIIDEERCKGCGLCIAACPGAVLEVKTGRFNMHGFNYANTVAEDKCTGCASCAIVCPDGCITVYRAKED